MQRFTGFTEDTTRFLGELAKHNDKQWFEANRERYERVWLEPARLFVEALGPKLKALSPAMQFEPKFDKSLVRIHKDMRFNPPGKGPFKTFHEVRFWEGDRQQPAFSVRLHPVTCLIMVGIPEFAPPLLARYRKAVLGDQGRALVKAKKDVLRHRASVFGDSLKRPPAGTDPAHPRAAWLLHTGLGALIQDGLPRQLGSAAFVDCCVARYKALLPIQRWLEKLTL